MLSAPPLDARLQAAADLVAPGARVADVGCDHGKLAVALAKSGRAARVIAIDLRPQPLARARQLAQQTGCGQLVDCRLASGLSCVAPGEVDTVVLAGISGITACQILADAPWVQNAGVRVVAVPANKPEVLRRFLAQQGFAVECETAVLAAGRPYLVLAARHTGQVWAPPALWCWLGALAGAPGPAALAWRQKQLHRLRRRLEGLCRAGSAAGEGAAADVEDGGETRTAQAQAMTAEPPAGPPEDAPAAEDGGKTRAGAKRNGGHPAGAEEDNATAPGAGEGSCPAIDDGIPAEDGGKTHAAQAQAMTAEPPAGPPEDAPAAEDGGETPAVTKRDDISAADGGVAIQNTAPARAAEIAALRRLITEVEALCKV